MTTEYTRRRGALLAAAAWHAWGARRALNANNLELRAMREAVSHG